MAEPRYTSCEIFDIIEALADTSGKAKQQDLTHYIECPNVQRVFKASLDPFTTYGVKKLPEVKSSGTEPFGQGTWMLLNELAERKLTGGNAQKAIEQALSRLTPASAELLKRILRRDLRAGFTAKSVNKAMPGLIFVFECMLAQKFEEKRIKEWPVGAEPKYDGVRGLKLFENNKGAFYSRTGKPFHAVQYLADQMAQRMIDAGMQPWVFDGELMSATGSFNKVVGDVHKKDVDADDAVFRVFDGMPLSAFQNGGSPRPYLERRKDLKAIIQDLFGDHDKVQLAPVRICKNVDEIMAMHNSILDQGGEGVIVKPLDGAYEKKRSYQWLKIKDQKSVDIPIIGFERGTGKYADTLGALVCDFNGTPVRVSGMSDDDRDWFWNHQEEAKGVLAEVHYHEETPDGSLRHPRFKKLRTDKPVEDGVGV